MDSPDRDVRGVKRDKCRMCSDCTGYRRNLGKDNSKCLKCGCPPGKHEKATTSRQDDQQSHSVLAAAASNLTLEDGSDTESFNAPKCQYCYDDAYFDVNTRVQYPCCQFHLPYIQDLDHDNSDASIPTAPPIISSRVVVANPLTDSSGKDPSLCAIEDCCKPRHIDEKGNIHDCCGFTHAMELSRRKAIEGELQYW